MKFTHIHVKEQIFSITKTEYGLCYVLAGAQQ